MGTWFRRLRAEMALNNRYPGPRGLSRVHYSDTYLRDSIRRYVSLLARWQRRFGVRYGFAPQQQIWWG